LLDLRVELPADTPLDALAALQEGEEHRYPALNSRMQMHGRFTVGAQVAAEALSTPVGYTFTSEDERQIFQARLDGFTFHRLAPYSQWPDFRQEAHRLWTVYRERLHPITVTRIALRYVNRLDLPETIRDLKEYLRTVPEVSPDLPHGLTGYLMQLQMPQDNAGTMLILNEAIVSPPRPNVTSVLLDLELMRPLQSTPDEAQLWQMIEELHDLMYVGFEASITDRTRNEVMT